MTRPRGRVRSVAFRSALVVAGVAAALGCAPTSEFSATGRAQPAAVNVDTGPLALRHVHLRAPDGDVHPAGAAVALHLTLVNDGTGADALVGADSPAADRIVLRDPGGAASTAAAPVRPGQPLRMQHPVDASLTLAGLRHDVPAGSTVPVTFRFAKAPTVTVQVPVAVGTRDVSPATSP